MTTIAVRILPARFLTVYRIGGAFALVPMIPSTWPLSSGKPGIPFECPECRGTRDKPSPMPARSGTLPDMSCALCEGQGIVELCRFVGLLPCWLRNPDRVEGFECDIRIFTEGEGVIE